ncbi:AIPR family protein [Actinoalloteichus spitiensis]|uniref:AIPR family protein n=1 Tax=Actinoalloteichus spitiensis TaxID=252394 RepID=UPI00068CCBFF|nr:AIPR family protein [Actinoalloteichus spitiensis]
MLALKIRHIRDALLREFSDHIEMSDVEKRSAPEREQVYLSRALTAFAIQDITGCTTADAAAGVIDGRDDHGIDGVAVNSGGAPHVWLVQTKWSDRAKAGLDLSAVLKLERGLTKLVNGEYDHFNSRFQKIAGEVDEALATPGVRITLVIALMGQSELAPEITAELDTICAKMNDGDEPMLDVVVRTLADFHRFVRDGLADPAIELEAHIEDVGQLADPYRAYYGTMPVAEVARWYSEHGERLFAKNIRRSLGVTEVNRDLMRTLREKPEHFWYFNNGITVLCDSVRRTARYATGEFHLTGASVVNGAQTVKSISEATREAPEALARGRVWVRFISLEHCPEGFASAVTKATNTQNRVEARDFVALDPDQARLRDEFALSLHKTYVVKRGEVDPAPDAGCSVVEAARALACAHRNPDWAARAKRDSSLLWERGEQGAYQALFGGKPSAFRVWRTVQALREVSARLRARQTALEGRAAQIVQQANLLTTHVVLQLLSSRAMDEPDGGVGRRTGADPGADRRCHRADELRGQRHVRLQQSRPHRLHQTRTVSGIGEQGPRGHHQGNFHAGASRGLPAADEGKQRTPGQRGSDIDRRWSSRRRHGARIPRWHQAGTTPAQRMACR